MASSESSLQNSDSGNSIQGLVVISFSQNTPNNQLIEKILRNNETTKEVKEYEPKSLDFGTNTKVNGFEMKIDNKYYLANIFLFDIRDKHLFSERLADSVNGVIVYFDSNEDSSFDGVKSCLSYINQFNNQIKLLICQTINEHKSQDINKWCLDNEFELVELCPQTDANDDDFEDIDGMTRILQAIEAYHWPHSTNKERPQYNPSHHFEGLIEKQVKNVVNETPEQIDGKHQISDQFNESQEIEDFDNFNHLFDKFSEMKVKSSQMSETERKDYAQQITMAFWKAIGGDINEIEGLEENDTSNQ